MKKRFGEIQVALTRKFGPLPVWAWALIAGAAIYVYRTRKGLASIGTGSAGASTSPGVTDVTGATGAGDASSSAPVPLQPGESVYDPKTGQLLGTSPPQQVGDSGGGSPGTSTPMDPITISPGEQVYDPNTHQLVGGSNNNAGGRGKRKPKPKAQHGKSKAAPHPGHGKSKPRSHAKITNPLHKKNANKPPKGRERGTGTNAPKRAPRSRAFAGSAPVMKQHTAAPKVVSPHTQRVAPHPAAPAHHTAPAPKPKRKR